MAAIFQIPYGTLLDTGGVIIPGGAIQFYNAGTTTPQTVYSDSGLTTPISQPIAADSAGRLPVIYLTTGSFKIVLKDASGNTLKTLDNLDSGMPAASGALAAAIPLFFAATTAAGARSAIGAAAASDVTTNSSNISSILAQITAVGGTLGALAGKSKLANTDLATGYGLVPIQRVVVASSSSLISCAGTIPFDNTIPQISEGTQILSGSFTPLSGSSLLEIACSITGSHSTGSEIGLAFFRDAIANAIDAKWCYSATHSIQMELRTRYASPGTSTYTFQARMGGTTGTFYVNGATGGTQIMGGACSAALIITEWMTY
jgi:hypothetical protein